MNVETGKLQPGQARCPAESTQAIIARDKVPAPGWVRSESYTYLGSEDIDTTRYKSAEYQEEEFKRLDPHLAVGLPRGTHPRGG